MIHCSNCDEPIHPAPDSFPPLCGECDIETEEKEDVEDE